MTSGIIAPCPPTACVRLDPDSRCFSGSCLRYSIIGFHCSCVHELPSWSSHHIAGFAWLSLRSTKTSSRFFVSIARTFTLSSSVNFLASSLSGLSICGRDFFLIFNLFGPHFPSLCPGFPYSGQDFFNGSAFKALVNCFRSGNPFLGPFLIWGIRSTLG